MITIDLYFIVYQMSKTLEVLVPRNPPYCVLIYHRTGISQAVET